MKNSYSIAFAVLAAALLASCGGNFAQAMRRDDKRKFLILDVLHMEFG